jgi:hypothetical protein
MNGIRYSDYRIRGEWLYGRGEWDDFPLDFASYTLSLQKVTDEHTLLRFAREFGGLGYEQLAKGIRSAKASESQLHGRLSEKRLRKIIRPSRGGEPIEWILAHARTMRTVIHTVSLLREFRATRKSEPLSLIKKIWRQGPFAVRGKVVEEAFDIDRVAFWRRGKVFLSEQWGLWAIQQFLGGNLRGIHLQLVFDLDGKPKVDFGFDAPIEGAYRQLLEELTMERLRICKNCHEIFRLDRTDQEHCTKKCRQNFATREHRKRKRATIERADNAE